MRAGGVYFGIFPAAFRAMELLTILNRCHHFRGFVYQHARFSADKKRTDVERLTLERKLWQGRVHSGA
jgi:hypothetical protein